jgi:integrase
VKELVYETLLPGRARATVRANLAPLRELFNHAIEDGVVTSNPAADVLKRIRGEKSPRCARPPRSLSAGELRALLAASPTSKRSSGTGASRRRSTSTDTSWRVRIERRWIGWMMSEGAS